MKKHTKNDIYPPEALTQLATAGLQNSFFMVALKLNVFQKLGKKKVSLKQFAKLLDLPVTSARALSQNLSVMGLLVYKDLKLSNSLLAHDFLANDQITQKLMMGLQSYTPSPSDLLETLKNPPPQPWYTLQNQVKKRFSLFKTKEPINESFYTDYHELRIRWGDELAQQYNFSKHRMLMDVGGACGGWSVGILRKYRNLSAIVLERPDVVPIVQKVVASNDVSDRITIKRSDFFRDQLPTNCDVILLANILHDWSPNDDERILRNIFSSINSKTVVLIKEFFFDNNWSSKSYYAALQSMLVLGPSKRSGWQPTYQEMKKLLQKVGFKNLQQKTNLLIAYKP